MIKDKMYVKIQDGGKIPAVFLGTVPFHEMGQGKNIHVDLQKRTAGINTRLIR